MENTSFTLKNRLALLIIACLTSQSILPLSAAQPDNLPATYQKNYRAPKTASDMTTAVATPVPAKATPPLTVIHTMDWTFLTDLPLARQSDRKSLLCRGGYLEPNRPNMNSVDNPADALVLMTADATAYHDDGFGTLIGNVVINQGYRQIVSDMAKLNRNEDIIDFEGNVIIREPNLLMTGDGATVNIASGKAEITDVQYVLHQKGNRGQASKIVRDEQGVITMNHATYSTCRPEDGAWTLKGKQVELNPLTGFGTARNATLHVYNSPVLYTPYLSFPIDDRRQTGFLYPTLGFGNDDTGFSYTQPWYWNIAPNYDATITPHYMSKRGLMLDNQFRYLTKGTTSNLDGAFLSTDALKNENRNYDENRWLINWRHEQRLSNTWDYSIHFANASDKDFLNDFDTGINMGTRTPLNQQFTSNYYGGGDSSHQWQFTANLEKLKNMSVTANDPYNREPQLTLRGDWRVNPDASFDYLMDYTGFDRDKNWHYRGKEQNTAFDKAHDIERSVYDEGTGIDKAVGQRLYLQSSMKYRFDRNYGFVEPSIGFSHVRYDLNHLDLQEMRNQMHDQSLSKNDIDTPSTTAPFYALDNGLFFEQPMALGGLKFTQTLEPRAKYLYVPYRSQQKLNPGFDTSEATFSYGSLWRNSRFSGYDRMGDTNQLTLGITTRFIEDNGNERFLFSMGQIFYAHKRKVFLDPNLSVEKNPNYDQSEARLRLIESHKASTSPLASQLTWNIHQELSLRQDWTFNTNHGHIDEYALGIHYLPKTNHALNFRYHYRDQVDRTVKDHIGNTVWLNPNTGIVVPPGTLGAIPKTASGNLEEADASFIIPLTTHWNTMGRWTYDITNSRNMERSLGIERDSCCYKVQILLRNWIDPYQDIDTTHAKNGVYVQFVLKGLGSLAGRQMKNFLHGIHGYRPEE